MVARLTLTPHPMKYGHVKILTNFYISTIDEFPFNSLKLQQFLKSIKELKQFHLYAKIDKDLTLSQFENKFWYSHHWSFAMYDNYLVRLPFHFDYFYELSDDYVTSNHRL
jgi:hypothetical protein